MSDSHIANRTGFVLAGLSSSLASCLLCSWALLQSQVLARSSEHLRAIAPGTWAAPLGLAPRVLLAAG